MTAIALAVVVWLGSPAVAGMMGQDDFMVSPNPSVFPDAAYGSQNGTYLVVMAEGTSGRITGRLVSADGAALGSLFYISDAGYGALYPAVAYCSANNEFLVTWDQWDRPGSIWGQRVNAATGALVGPNFAIGTRAVGIRSAVAWSSASNCYLVVYFDTSEVYGQRVSNSGALLGGNFNISNDVPYSGYPAVSYGSGSNRFLVTWDYSPDQTGTIRGRLVSASDGSLFGSTIVLTTLGAEDRSSSAYDSLRGRWMVQYNEGGNPGYSYDQYGQFVNDDGSLSGGPIPIAHTTAFEGETTLGCDIACVPSMGRYFSVYQYFVNDVGGIGGTELYASGQPACPQVMPGVGNGYGRHANAADTRLSRFLTVWESFEGGHYYIRGQVYACDTDVTTDTPSGAYRVGQAIDIGVTFSMPAFVAGSPQLALNAASGLRVNYLSGSGTNTLLFRYVVRTGDMTPDLDCSGTNALTLNGGTITDSSGAAIDVTLPAPGAVHSLGYNKNIVIDTTRPTITNVTSSKANGSYKQGEIINIQITFSDSVFVTGGPRIELETGAAKRNASYASGSGSGTLTFTYIVSSGDVTPDLDYTGTGALSLNGGTIRDAAANDATLALPQPGSPGSLGGNRDILIDAQRPTVRNVTSLTANGSYRAGTEIDILVVFSEPINVTGTPQLELETSAVDQKANYVSGTGTDTLAFRYVVQPADAAADLGYKATNSLTTNGGSIRDIIGNFGTLTLPAPGAQWSLSYNKDIAIDNAAPGVTTADPSAGVYTSAKSVTLTATEPGAIYYTTDGAEPTAASSLYTGPVSIAADTTLRFFAVDQAGNEESPKREESYVILSGNGSIAACRQLPDTGQVRLGNKVLYMKQGGWAYIEEPDRSSGIRIEGSIPADEGRLVCLVGTMQTTLDGERCILVGTMAPAGVGAVAPVGMSNRALSSALAEGLLVSAWGRVKAGSVTANSYVITDGSGDLGIRVITSGAPGVAEGQYVTVSGAAGLSRPDSGWTGGRVIRGR